MYKLYIPNKKLLIYQVFGYGILVLNLLGLFIYNVKAANKSYTIYPALLLLLLVVIVDIYKYKTKKTFQSLGILMIFCGACWMVLGVYQLLFVNLLFWALYTISKRNLVIEIAGENISYPSFPKKIIPWNELNNVVLKDDILTIDLKNNKIYQHYIEYADKEVAEDEFNIFCQKQIKQVV